MARFLIGHGPTGFCFEVEARSAAAACAHLGWSRRDCAVVRLADPCRGELTRTRPSLRARLASKFARRA